MKRGYTAHARCYIENTFPHRLDLLMQEYDENVTDIARLCFVGRKTVYAWLDYSTTIKSNYAVILADHYKVSLDWLLCRRNYTREGGKQ